MDDKTLKALEGSIEKWKKIERSTRALDKGNYNCPLCKLFVKGKHGLWCTNCPIKKKTGRVVCEGSPYDLWKYHQLYC